MVTLWEDTLDNIAHRFRKHSPDVCKRHYIQDFKNKIASNLSWKCHQLHNQPKKGTESCKIKISEKHTPDIKEVNAWYKKIWNIFKLEYNISGENSGKSHGKK